MRSLNRSSQEFPGSIEGTIKFDALSCCALKHAFDRNPETVDQLKEIVPNDKLKIFSDVLTNTDEMNFVPTEEMKVVYFQLAKKEVSRLGSMGNLIQVDLDCSHTVADHIKVLENVIRDTSIITH